MNTTESATGLSTHLLSEAALAAARDKDPGGGGRGTPALRDGDPGVLPVDPGGGGRNGELPVFTGERGGLGLAPPDSVVDFLVCSIQHYCWTAAATTLITSDYHYDYDHYHTMFTTTITIVWRSRLGTRLCSSLLGLSYLTKG